LGSIEEVELLRRRARSFARYAEEANDRGDFDLACFFAEQALQLRLKSLILRILGFMPRGHRVREIMGLLIRALEEMGVEERVEVSEAVSRFRDELRMLEDAYIASRYLSRRFDDEDAGRAVETIHSLLKLLDGVEGAIFGG